mmetsp:Transcript_28606/g.68185  ORF Transcript_28606/g.68185 Transcript_28606/m.68185 type:complete len:201 (+) Transcript_28606:264-866(+)
MTKDGNPRSASLRPQLPLPVGRTGSAIPDPGRRRREAREPLRPLPGNPERRLPAPGPSSPPPATGKSPEGVQGCGGAERGTAPFCALFLLGCGGIRFGDSDGSGGSDRRPAAARPLGHPPRTQANDAPRPSRVSQDGTSLRPPCSNPSNPANTTAIGTPTLGLRFGLSRPLPMPVSAIGTRGSARGARFPRGRREDWAGP